MFEKTSRIVFTILFFGMLIIPLVNTNFSDGSISEAENRVLASKPHIHKGDGTLNREFTNDFEKWINDNIGFRAQMVATNANMQFYIFNALSNNGEMILGPNGELNYATNDIIRDYQHLNLLSDESLEAIAESYQIINDYLEASGIQFYYFQCWDKQSIYPEHFPKSIMQYGDISKTDQIISALKNNTTVKVISPKQELISAKSYCNPYGVWCDPTHWTKRGARIGYELLMDEINRNNDGEYLVLHDDDYNIEIKDTGKKIFGGIHKSDYEEVFSIRSPHSYQNGESVIYERKGAQSNNILQNDLVDNEDTLLILGDSYFESFLYYDFAESFHKVVMIWGDYMSNLQEIVDYYKPTIVICENAERCDRTSVAVRTARILENQK